MKKSIHVTVTGERKYDETTSGLNSLSICKLQHGTAQCTAVERVACFEIIWITAGSGSLRVDDKMFQFGDNTMFCLMPGQLRHYTPDKDVKGYVIGIAPEFLHLLQNQFEVSFLFRYSTGNRNKPMVVQNKDARQELEDLILRMEKELNNSLLMRSESLKGYLKIFLICLGREFNVATQQEVSDKSIEVVHKFMDLLNHRIASMKLVADYADELCVTPNYLNFIIKKHTGQTASHHIQQYIVREAKRQAIYSGLRMKEIADYLGFADHAHFSKFFKNYSGVNFTSFKKTIANGTV